MLLRFPQCVYFADLPTSRVGAFISQVFTELDKLEIGKHFRLQYRQGPDQEGIIVDVDGPEDWSEMLLKRTENHWSTLNLDIVHITSVSVPAAVASASNAAVPAVQQTLPFQPVAPESRGFHSIFASNPKRKLSVGPEQKEKKSKPDNVEGKRRPGPAAVAADGAEKMDERADLPAVVDGAVVGASVPRTLT